MREPAKKTKQRQGCNTVSRSDIARFKMRLVAGVPLSCLNGSFHIAVITKAFSTAVRTESGKKSWACNKN